MLSVTATELSRLMACNGSRMMDNFTPSVGDNTIRNEGNAADWLVKQVHNNFFTAEELIDRKAPNGVYITDVMVEYLGEYLDDIQGGDIETDTSHEGENWQVNGRADLIKYNPLTKILTIGDLKYGWRIVNPKNNWTLISHAIGWMSQHPDEQVGQFRFVIYQPRPHHYNGRVRFWQISEAEFKELQNKLDETLSNPNDQLNTTSHCYNCFSATQCPAFNEAEMNGIDASEKVFNDEISNDELSFKLNNIKRAIEVLKQAEKAYFDVTLHRLKQGQIIKNYSLVKDLARTTWKKYVTPELITTWTGKNVTKKALITPNQAKKAGVHEEIINSLTERLNKGVKIIQIDADTIAKKMFSTK